MKDVTASVFGLLIAYVLPGFVLLWGLTFFLYRPSELIVYGRNLTSSSGIITFLLLTCLTLSLVLGAARYYLFEKWICSSEHFDKRVYSKLRTTDGLLAFRQAIDEHYRYYQFHGGLVLALPVLCAGFVFVLRGRVTFYIIFLGILAFAGVETMEFRAAVDQLRATFIRGRLILDDSEDEIPSEPSGGGSWDKTVGRRTDMNGGNPTPSPAGPIGRG